MCRKTNIYFLVLQVWTLLASFLLALVLDSSMSLWLSTVVNYVIMLIPTGIFIVVMKCKPKDLSFRMLPPLEWVLCLLFGYALIPLMTFINFISMIFVQNHLSEAMEEYVLEYPLVGMLVLIAVIPALAEELMFRGLVFGGFRKKGLLGAVLMTGLYFGLFHFNFNQFAYAAVMGMIFAVLVEVTGSILSSMLAHFAVNSYSVILLWLTSQAQFGDTMESMEGSADTLAQYESMMPVIMVVAAVMLLVMAVGFGALALIILMQLAKRHHYELPPLGRKRKAMVQKTAGAVQETEEQPDAKNEEDRAAKQPFFGIIAACSVIFSVAIMVIMEISA